MKKYLLSLALALTFVVVSAFAQTLSTGVTRDSVSCSDGTTITVEAAIKKADGTFMTPAELDAFEVQAMKNFKTNNRVIVRSGWTNYPADCMMVAP